MRIAFYAPLKPPDHAVPSGDRRVARLLMAALRARGHQVELASRLRSYDRTGDERRQRRLRDLGGRIAARLLRRYRARPAAERPQAWFTYHLYHKAPDWLGPAVAGGLGIPYVVAEASHAPKRRGGPWHIGFEGAAEALARADAVVGFNPRDAACVRPVMRPGASLLTLRPFLDLSGAAAPATGRSGIAAANHVPDNEPWLLAVAMLRPDKIASYRVLGAALSTLRDRPWRLLVAGDGTARGEAARALAPLADRVHWLGEQDAGGLAALYGAADLMVWPAVNEAFGMALLEAQAAGVAVVAGDAGGVGCIVRQGVTGLLAPEGDAGAFAAAVAALLDDPGRRQAMGGAARRIAAAEHGIEAAAAVLDDVLIGVTR